ncbi:MAG: iron ABC transporter permease [Flammeovirgaceae bacterium]|nr:iron ABC transporter permease [Flammeovirgaceae bacterium]
MNQKVGIKLRWWLLGGSVLLLFLADLTAGSTQIPISEIVKIIFGFSPLDPIHADIIFNFRLPKTVTCVLTGSALSIAGLLMQTLFRNPLAGPDVFGLSSGAGLAVAFVVMAGLSSQLNVLTIPLAASIGCAGVFVLVFVAAQKIRNNVSILIIGLMIGATTSSIVSILQFFTQAESLQQFLIWTFGSISTLNWTEISFLAGVVLAACFALFVNIKSMNGWLLGESYAQSIGIQSKKVKTLAIVTTSILTGVVTSLCGPIAFVGLAVPHMTRILLGTTNHKNLLPGVIFLGSVLMLVCDILANMPGGGSVLPVNAMTSLIGAPIVVWILIRAKRVYV